VQYCKEKGIVIEAYSPLTSGKYLDHPVLQRLATQHGKDTAQILVRWSLQMGYGPLPKSQTPSRVLSNSQVYEFELSKEDMNALHDLDKGADGATTWNPVEAK